MGDKVEPRRKWIEKNVKFSLEEDGSLLDTVAVEGAHGEKLTNEETSETLFDDKLAQTKNNK